MPRLLALSLTAISWWIALFFATVAWAAALRPALASSPRLVAAGALALALGAVLAPVVALRSARARAAHGAAVDAVAQALDGLAARPLLWNAVFAGLALFVEMSIIRWVSGLLPHLAHLRNFSLLACFLGLGIGTLTGRRAPALVPYLLPLLGLHVLQARLLATYMPLA